MLAGFIIVPVVSFFTKKPPDEKLEPLFKPFCEMSEAVETAADGYLTKEPEKFVLTDPSESYDGESRSAKPEDKVDLAEEKKRE